MKTYQPANKGNWQGRQSTSQLYLHEKIQFGSIVDLKNSEGKNIAMLGYACDAGVQRNQGRIGAVKGPEALRKMLATLSNHFSQELNLWDLGDMICDSQDLEIIQEETARAIANLIKQEFFPLILGGGHDLAYAHFNGIRLAHPGAKIGIINLDAHFDLRPAPIQGNSGTPFWQIAKNEKEFNLNYLCLGIQKESNNRELFEIAKENKVEYFLNTEFSIEHWPTIRKELNSFTSRVDFVYLTIDLDGFTSALAPGVSAPSPLGFQWEIAYKTIAYICQTEKLISADIVELNPTYDQDNSTARLASRIAYLIIEKIDAIQF